VEFTGERLIPDKEKLLDLYYEHFARYLYATEFVEDRVVLDLGCGCGYGTYELAEAGAKLAVGIDNSAEAIDYARGRYEHENSTFAVADALALPFADDSFGAVVCMEVLEHLEDQKRLLSEVARVLGDEGILFISTPNPNRPSISDEEKPNPFHVREVELEEFKDLLSKHFKNVEMLYQARRSAIWLWRPREEAEALQGLDAPQPEYFLAVCSNSELPEILGCMYHFSHFENVKSLLGHLRDQDVQMADRGEKIVELQRDIEEKVGWARRLELAVVTLRRLVAHHEARAILFKQEYERAKGSLGYRIHQRLEPVARFLWRALKKLPRFAAALIKATLALPFVVFGLALLLFLSALTALYVLPVLLAWVVIGVISPNPRPKPKTLDDFAQTDGVSIVIPSWNGKDLLAASLPSLVGALEKTKIEHEVIVIDDASEDGTEAWLRQKYPKVKVYRLQNHMGFSRAMNAGFAAADYQLVYALNNDMIVEEGFLEPLVEQFRKNRSLFAAASYIRPYAGKERVESGWTWAKMRKGLPSVRHRLLEPDDPVVTLYAGGGASLFRKDVFMEVGGFDPIYQPFYVEDLDLSFKAWRHGYEVVLVPQSRVIHKHRGTIGRHWRERALRRIYQTNFLRFCWQNFTDLFDQHFLHLPLRLALGTLGLAGGVSPIGFAKAFFSIPAVIINRRNVLASILTDREAIELSRYPNLYRERFERPPKQKGQLEILMIAPYCPYPPTHGGALRMYNIIKHLSERCVVDLAAMVEQPHELGASDFLKKYCREVRFHLRRRDAAGPLSWPKSVGEFVSDEFEEIVSDLCARNDYHIVQVEYPFLAHFLPMSERFKRVVTEIDIFFIAYKRAVAFQPTLRKKLEATYEWLKMFRYEMQAMRDADYVLTVSEHDKGILERYLPQDKIYLCPNGVDCDEFPFQKERAEEPDLFFVGNFRHPPNVEGLLWFHEKVWPLILFEQPLVKLKIAGANPPDEIVELGREENIEVLGFVDDLRPLYAKSIFITPILRGGGTRLKILEAMASGAPVVSTTLGAEGLLVTNGNDIAIADEPEMMAQRIAELLQSPVMCKKLAENARALVEGRYHWPKIVDRLFSFYKRVAGL